MTETEHFSDEDVAAWEDTVQGDPEVVGPPSEATAPGVPDDVAAKAEEWAGSKQGNEEGLVEADDAEGAGG